MKEYSNGKRHVEEQIVSTQDMEDAIQSQLSPNNMPSPWRKAKLSEISNVLYGKARLKRGGQIPVIGSGGIYGTTSEPLVTYETLVIGRKGSAGSIYYSPEPCYPSDTTFYLQWTQEVSVPYIYNFLLFQGLAPDKSVIPSLQRGDIENIKIVLAPLPQQHAIANVLRTVQQAIQARQDELDLERERKTALMEYLFIYGTRGEETKQTEFGEIPESWDIVKFAEAVRITNGQVNPIEEPYKTMKHVGPENIEQDTGKLFETKTNQELNIISGNYYFTPEDVLYSKIRPYLNKVALPPFEGTCSADMYPLRPIKSFFTREFLYHLFLSERVKNQTIAFQNRTGIPKINRDQLGSIFLPKPSLEEQVDIAGVLSKCNTKIYSLENEVLLLDELFRALLEGLMTGRLSTLPLIEEGETHE
jgi:restriction endonuclease S subunit